MTPEERQLITGLFDRMRGFSLAEKDGEAEALIGQQVAALRDAPYMLVQSVLVQEHALQQADARIRELEEQVRELQSAAQPQPAGAGSFLGGLFGSRPAAEPDRAATSVPAMGSRATPPVYGNRPVWGQQQPGQQQPGGPFAQAAQQPAGGGFLRSAMATAAGVAGGMLVAGAIGNMLGGSHASASTGQPSSDAAGAASVGEGAKETAQAQDAAASSNAAQEPSYQEAADTDDGWFGGDDGGDFDI
jgi:hypothetical protein